MGQNQQGINQSTADIDQVIAESTVRKEQRNDALDEVAHLRGKVRLLEFYAKDAKERIAHLSAINDNYAKEIEAQAKRIENLTSPTDKVSHTGQQKSPVTMLNTASSISGVAASSEGQTITVVDAAAAQHAKFIDSMTTPTSILDHA